MKAVIFKKRTEGRPLLMGTADGTILDHNCFLLRGAELLSPPDSFNMIGSGSAMLVI